MKKYLDWSDNEIKQNREWLRKDKQLSWELAQIEQFGPNWREQLLAQAEQMEAGMEPAPGGDLGGGLGGGIDSPPDFGGPAPIGGDAAAAPPPAEPGGGEPPASPPA